MSKYQSCTYLKHSNLISNGWNNINKTVGYNLNTQQFNSFLNYCNQTVDCNSCKNILEKLYVAKSSMIPVIDEIIHSASAISNTDYKWKSKASICSVSIEKFAGALKASKILEEVNFNLSKINDVQRDLELNLPNTDVIINTLCYADCAANPQTLGPNDRVYINKELMRQLIELHEFLGMTIYRLKETENIKPNKSTISTTRKSETTVPNKKIYPSQTDNMKNTNVSYVSGDRSTIKSIYDDDSCCGYATHTVKISSPKESKKEENKHEVKSSQSSDVRSYPFCCCPRKSKKKPSKTKVSQEKKKVDETCCTCNSTTVQSVTYSPDTTKKTRSSTVTQSERTYGSASEYSSERTDPCRQELERLQREYNALNETLAALKQIAASSGSEAELRKKINNIQVTGSKSISTVKSARRINDMTDAKRCILECLEELSEVRKFLKAANNAELDLQSKIQLEGSPENKDCCTIDGDTHLHAKLNGIPVILKLNQV